MSQNRAEYQAANDPSRPLNSLSESEVDFELVRIAKAIDRILEPGEIQPGDKPDSPECPKALEIETVVGKKTIGEQEKGDVGASDEGAREKIRQALADGKWAWRSLDALKAKAALSTDATLRILRQDPEIELGIGKSGGTIARLRTRIP